MAAPLAHKLKYRYNTLLDTGNIHVIVDTEQTVTHTQQHTVFNGALSPWE